MVLCFKCLSPPTIWLSSHTPQLARPPLPLVARYEDAWLDWGCWLCVGRGGSRLPRVREKGVCFDSDVNTQPRSSFSRAPAVPPPSARRGTHTHTHTHRPPHRPPPRRPATRLSIRNGGRPQRRPARRPVRHAARHPRQEQAAGGTAGVCERDRGGSEGGVGERGDGHAADGDRGNDA